jgi:hypothetical protein
MIILDVLYVAIATIFVMVLLQLSTFLVARLIEPRVVYRDVVKQAPPVIHYQQPVLTKPPPIEVTLPEYEQRKPIQLEPELPNGLKETRPEGT